MKGRAALPVYSLRPGRVPAGRRFGSLYPVVCHRSGVRLPLASPNGPFCE